MTGTQTISQGRRPTCYQQLRLSKRPHRLFTASCPEYVCLTPFSFYFPTSAHAWLTPDLVGQCLSIATNKPEQDPRQILNSLDTWRRSLATKMHIREDTGTDVYYLNIRAMSYRFECILCRLIRRSWQQSEHADWSEWAKQRLRSAILELDAISVRVLSSGTLQDFPVPL